VAVPWAKPVILAGLASAAICPRRFEIDIGRRERKRYRLLVGALLAV
jgi:hypothetical protein